MPHSRTGSRAGSRPTLTYNEVFSPAASHDGFEDERGGDDDADALWADGDALESTPVAEEGVGSFGRGSQVGDHLVVRPVVGVQLTAAGGAFDRGVDADAGAGVALVG